MADKWLRRCNVAESNGHTWVVAIDKEGKYGCSCPVWKFKREECHHILQVKTNGGEEIKQRNAQPGHVGEVTVKKDGTVLYPLVPFDGGVDLPATIVFDLLRANVASDQVKDYAKRFFPHNSLKQIINHVEQYGRCRD